MNATAGLKPAKQTTAARTIGADTPSTPSVQTGRAGDDDAVIAFGGLGEPDELAGVTNLGDLISQALAKGGVAKVAPQSQETELEAQALTVTLTETEAPPVTTPPPPAVEAPPPATPESPEATEESETGDEEEEGQPEGGPNLLSRRQRIPLETDLDAMTASIYRAAAKAKAPISFGEAERRAKVALGVEDAPAAAPAAQAAPPPPAPKLELPEGTPTESAAILARLRELPKLIRDAVYDEDVLNPLMDEQERLTDSLPKVQAHEAALAARQEQAAAQAFDARISEAKGLYPDMADEQSALFRRADEIYRSAVPGSYFDDPLNCAVAAADEMRIPPGTRTTRPEPPKAKNPPAPSSPSSPARTPPPLSASSAHPASARSAAEQAQEVFDILEREVFNGGLTIG